MTLVYIVDDDDAVRDSLGILLESAGRTIEAFPGAEPVLERCKAKVPDCLVTDVRMPGMDGMAEYINGIWVDQQSNGKHDQRKKPRVARCRRAEYYLLPT